LAVDRVNARTRHDGPVHNPGLRRAPAQRRSAERFDRILDAAAVLLDERGYEQLSTREVAARAEVPIGSVYRFFSNKRALVEALADRNLEEYAVRVHRRITAADAAYAAEAAHAAGAGETRDARDAAARGPAFPAWSAAVSVVVDEYVAMLRAVPGFARVSFAGPGAGPDLNDRANRTVAARLGALLAGPLGLDPADERLRVAFAVGVEAADALLKLAFRADPAGDPEIVAETKFLLLAYLERAFPDRDRAGAGPYAPAADRSAAPVGVAAAALGPAEPGPRPPGC
jgi:AcrR family transcriptional regulator